MIKKIKSLRFTFWRSVRRVCLLFELTPEATSLEALGLAPAPVHPPPLKEELKKVLDPDIADSINHLPVSESDHYLVGPASNESETSHSSFLLASL